MADADADAAVDPSAADAIADLRRAHERLRDVEADLDAVDEGAARAAANAVRRADRLLDSYEDSATGTGDFQAYVEFQEEFASLVGGLDEDLPRRDAFEAALEVTEQRRLRERDFERAREALAPARALEDLLEDHADALDAYREARHAVERRLDAVDDRIADLERVRRLGEADLDAPVDRLREPVAAYNGAVREDFASFRSSASAREVIGFVESAAARPLVEVRRPPADLAEYVREYPAGEEPIPTLLEYADYSASKLDHYVEDPGALRARVATHRTYLTRLDAEPLTVAWPPPPGGVLRHRADELLSLLRQFAAEPTAARLREVRSLARREDYGRLREAAHARDELDERERERLADGAVADDLEAARRRREDLAAALEEFPER
ncbi:MAG: hypothetical protein ABEI39_03000 [Halobacteriales archaeon]